MFPEMVDQPCSSGLPVGPIRVTRSEVTDRIGHAPDVGIVMTSPTPAIIEGPRSDGSCVSEIAYKRKQWLMQFGKVADFHWPVIHFRIDIDRIIAAPRRPHLFVPDSLQVDWSLCGAGPADQ